MSNSVWISSVICLVVGAVIGLIIGRLMTSRPKADDSANSEQRSQQQQLRQDIDDHFQQLTHIADQLSQQSKTLNTALAEQADRLSQNDSVKRRLAVLSGARSAEEVAEEEAATHGVPRDYADAKGTLSEGFGIRRPQDEYGEQDKEPPRY
ncbi:ZapG family protein [Carnimonas bestiolae]|uniref:ZapG family protein n=1 Tax=Carnimonas bestiolae TaxID=3402172 RepID=UPI003EDB752D